MNPLGAERIGSRWVAAVISKRARAAIVQIAEHYPISRGGWRTRVVPAAPLDMILVRNGVVSTMMG